MFIDYAKIYVKAGNGGNGVISFRREKFVPRGGPDGGNGGNGGNVILKADAQLTTLLDFHYRKHYKAERGEHGQGSNKTGRSGKDIIIRVPCGTLVKDAETNSVLADLVENGQEFIAARGGKGGRGNAAFATSTNQAPRIAEPGEKGEERTLILELKLLADVGLVGFPNVGKSTLLATISAAHPKIADYPFTTLEPVLGIVRYREYQSFVVADIPGLIEGSHEGKGLGIQFLKHIERTRVLAILVSSETKDLRDDVKILMHELRSFNPILARKPRLIVITKTDLVDQKTVAKLVRSAKLLKLTAIPISAVQNEGITELLDAFWDKLQQARRGGRANSLSG